MAVSFEAEYTANSDALRALSLRGYSILERKKTKYIGLYTIVGKVRKFLKKKPPFLPSSPYAVAKLYAYWIVVNYRAYKHGIL